MFSPKRSSDRKDDRKAKRERFRRMYDNKDNNNIKLNILGVPKEQVSVKKSQEESNNENLFKIYINTHSNEDKKDKTKALGVTDTARTEPARRAGIKKNDVCLTLPGEKKRDIKIIQRPRETFSQETFKQPDDHIGTNVQNTRHDRTAESRPRKHRPKKQVGFSDYDAVYGTGSEQSLSSDDDMPFDKRSPIVYQVEGIKPESGFGGTGLNPRSDLKTIYLDKNSVTRPLGEYETLEHFQESKPKQLYITPSPSPTIKQFANLSMDDNFSPQSYQKIKEQHSRNDSTKESLLNVVGERHPETQTPNVTKPMKVDREVMTDRPNVINKGNISNKGSSLSKPLPVSKHSSKESTDSNQSSDQTKPRKSLVSSIPKPDFGMFRRSKSSKSTAEHGKDPEAQSKKSQENNENDPKFLQKETGLNMTSKTPRKLTPISIKNNNYKPIFFPLEVKEDFEKPHIRPNDPSFMNLRGDSFENIAINPNNTDKETSKDPNVNGKEQSKDKMIFTDPQEKASVGKNEEISNKKYPSIATINEFNDNKSRPSNLVSFLPSSEIVTDDHLKNENQSKPGKIKKQTSMDPGFEKLDGEIPSVVDTLRTQQDKVSAGKSNEISSITYLSTSISEDPNPNMPSSLITVDDRVEMSPTFNLNEERPPIFSTSSSNNYKNPLQLGSVAGENRPTAQDNRQERRPVDDIMTRLFKKQYNEPNLPELGGYVGLNNQEPSYGLPQSEGTHDATVETKPGTTTSYFSRSTLSSTGSTGTLDSSRPNLDQESKGEQKKLERTPSPLTEQLASLFMVDRRVNPQKDRKLTDKPFLNEVQKSPAISEPEISPQVNDTQSDVNETDSLRLLSGIHPNDYVSTGAIPRTTSTVESTKGSLSSAQLVLPSVGERLSKRGSPFIETIEEEDTDDIDSLHGSPDYKTNQATEKHGNLQIGKASNNYDVDSSDVFVDGHDKIDKDRTNIMAFAGHLVDNTPFAYSPSSPGAHPLDHAHPEDTIQEQAAPHPDNDIRKPSRTSKVGQKRTRPGKKRRKSSLIRDRSVDSLADQKENGSSVFGQGPQRELIYLGKIPNTTYNVFYAPDEAKTPENMESKTVVPIRSQKMISEGPKGILIFVNKKNDHKCPFKTNGFGDQTTNSDENKGMKSNKNDASLTDDKGVEPKEGSAESRRGRDPNKDKKVTVKRTSDGKIVTEDFPCGCYRITRFDMADVLQTEEFISGLCKDASSCEVAHPELAKNRETAYRPGKETRVHERQKKHPSYDHGNRFPGLEVIAKGVVSKEPIKPRPPGQKMNGANLLASFNIKSNKLKGVCNLYFDDSLKRYLRENLTSILETDDKTRQKRLSN